MTPDTLTHNAYRVASYPDSGCRTFIHCVIAPDLTTLWRGIGLVAKDLAIAICDVLNEIERRVDVDSPLLAYRARASARYLLRMSAYTYDVPREVLRAAGLMLVDGDAEAGIENAFWLDGCIT